SFDRARRIPLSGAILWVRRSTTIKEAGREGSMKRTVRRLVWTFAAIIRGRGPTVTAVYAQRIWAGYYGRTPPKFATATTFDGNFHFCRALFTSEHREEQSRGTDYPRA